MIVDKIITIISILIGSGLVQWWFGRKDKQKEDAKKILVEWYLKSFICEGEQNVN